MAKGVTQLSVEEVQKIESIAKRSAQEKHKVWFEDEEEVAIYSAYKAGQRKVVLKGKTFRLRKVERRNELLVSPTQGFTPCGVFDLERLEREVG